MSDLLPCPCCGGAAMWRGPITKSEIRNTVCWAECTSCRLQSGRITCGEWATTIPDFVAVRVAEAWNRRAQPAPGAEVLELLREIVDEADDYCERHGHKSLHKWHDRARAVIAAHSAGKGE